MRITPILWIAFVLGLAACGTSTNPTNPQGLDWHYYLDTHQTLMSDILKYGTKINRYVETIHHTNGKVDTNFLGGTMVNWDLYIKPFVAMNMRDSSFQGLYTMRQDIDTNTKTVDIRYDPLYENTPVRLMIVKMSTTTSEVESVYGELKNKGAFTVDEQKVLYHPGKLIQIVESKGILNGKQERSARQLDFIQPTPEITITNALDK